MSDWENVTKIGSKHRGAGAAPRETTIKGKSALNAAQRSGAILSTDKKFTTGNLATKGGPDGQHLAKVDRTDDIVKPKTVGPQVADAVKRRRNEEGFKMTQKELATKCNALVTDIQKLEAGQTLSSDPLVNKVSKQLKIKLTGNDIGSPLTFGKKK